MRNIDKLRKLMDESVQLSQEYRSGTLSSRVLYDHKEYLGDEVFKYAEMILRLLAVAEAAERLTRCEAGHNPINDEDALIDALQKLNEVKA